MTVKTDFLSTRPFTLEASFDGTIYAKLDTGNVVEVGKITGIPENQFLAHAAIDAVNSYRKFVQELEELTPGGSEFHNSPRNCIAWAKTRIESSQSIFKKVPKGRTR